MNADLEQTLKELGPEYRAVVDRLTGAFEEKSFSWRRPALLAASLLVCLGGVWQLFRTSVPAREGMGLRSAYVLAYAPDAATLATIIRTQRPDGSWQNDFITRQNAAALREASGDESRVAYRRALRYLRTKGLEPLSEAELRARGELAARQLARS